MKREVKKTIAAILALTIASGAMVVPAFAETTEGIIGEAIAIGYSSTEDSANSNSSETNYVEMGSVTQEFVSPLQYSGIQPVVLEDGRTAWFRWSRKPGETPYQGYWLDGVKIAETKEELAEWCANQKNLTNTIGSSSNADVFDAPIITETITVHVSQPAISGVVVYIDGSMLINGQHIKTIDNVLMLEVDGVFVPAEKIGDRYYPIEKYTDEEVSDTADESENDDCTIGEPPLPDLDCEEVIQVMGPPIQAPVAPDNTIMSSIAIEKDNSKLSDDFDEEKFALDMMQLDEMRMTRKNIAVGDYLSYALATIDKNFYGETSFISLDEFIEADETVCVNEDCHTNVSLRSFDEGYEEKVNYRARNFYYDDKLNGVEVELYEKSVAEGRLNDSITESSTQKIAEKRVYENEDESIFLGEIKCESFITPYDEIISESGTSYEISIILSFDGIEKHSDGTIKEFDGYILKKVLFTYEDNDIIIEGEDEESYCMVAESEASSEDFMKMIEEYESELEIRIK